MSSTLSEFNATDLIERIAKGEIPRDFTLYAARGFLPVPQEDLVAVVSFLAGHDDEEISTAAKESLLDFPSRIVVDFARSEIATTPQLDSLAATASDPQVLEAVIRNRATSDEAVARLAANVEGGLLEVIVINQERILRTPSILEALLQNPHLTADVRRRAMEVREEFFDKQRVVVEPVALPEDEEPLDEAAQAELDRLLALAAAQDGDAQTLPLPTGLEEALDKADSVWTKILKMSVSQKVQMAFKAGKTERGILIRDRNKLVCSAVVRSPRITESEIEAFAGMRNVEEEVLRIIGSNREYTSKYPVILALVRNPKAPIGVVLPLINHLTLKDLKNLTGDRNVTEVIRGSAKKLFAQRNKKN